MKMLLHKTALITGGAQGIGAATVRRFVQEGAKVVIADIDAAGGAALAHELGAAVRFVSCDHTDAGQCATAVDAAVALGGGLDILFNNAGFGWTGAFDQCAEETLARLLAVNVHGPWRMTAAALPLLKESGARHPAGAALLFNSSGLGLHSRAMTSAYSMIKHGIVGLMRALAEEYGPANVRVNAVCPGMVDTAMTRRSTTAWGQPDEAMEQVRRGLPLRRNPTVDDVAAAAAFLCSDLAACIHSVALPVDGGGHG